MIFIYTISFNGEINMYVTTIEIVMDIKKKDLEEKLNSCTNIDEYNIEELDKEDYRKNVLISFANPIDIRGVETELKNTLKLEELPKKGTE